MSGSDLLSTIAAALVQRERETIVRCASACDERSANWQRGEGIVVASRADEAKSCAETLRALLQIPDKAAKP